MDSHLARSHNQTSHTTPHGADNTHTPHPQASNEPSDEAIRGTLDSLHERAKGATFVVTHEPDTVRGGAATSAVAYSGIDVCFRQ